MQATTRTAPRPTLTVVRRPARRPHASNRHPAPAGDIDARISVPSAAADFRALLARAFTKLGSGVDAATAQAQANAFYRSTRQDWTRWPDIVSAQAIRREVAAAFRALGASVDDATAQGRTVAFYRGSGQPWAADLG